MKNKKAEKTEAVAKREPRFLLGFAAGAVGGLAGAVAIVAMEQFSGAEATRQSSRGPVDSLRVREPGPWTPNRARQTAASGQHIHWAVGALAGGVYGMVAEVWPQVTEGNGAAFGLVLSTATHEAPIATSGILSELLEQTPLARAGNVTTHAVYGLTAEFVRKHVRSWLESRDKKDPRGATLRFRRNVNLKLTA